MGITGLLPFLKKATKKSHLRHFSGATVAVDTFGWLHKGAFGCAQKLGTGEPTTAYVTFCIKYVNLLREHGLKPILVFDGRNLPAKAPTDEKRRASRKENKEKARKALLRGDKRTAWECFTRSIEITTQMVREVIKVLQQEKIDYIIAPYEADAQLAYLSRSGIANMVITEDSDLVLFGCDKIFFKLSATGDGVLFDQSKLHLCMEVPRAQFDFQKFRQMCILSGCDYLPSLAGIGLVRAKKVFTIATNPDIRRVLKQVPTITKLDIEITDEYIDQFIQAEKTFLYQLVFDPLSKSMLPLTPYDLGESHIDFPYAGKYESKKIALELALGNIDVKTGAKTGNFYPGHESAGYPDKSIWSKKFKKEAWSKNLTTSYDDLKIATKHSSTTGKTLKITASITGIVTKTTRKRSIRCVDSENGFENELNDEELVSIYKSEDTSFEAEAVIGSPELQEEANGMGDEGLQISVSNDTAKQSPKRMRTCRNPGLESNSAKTANGLKARTNTNSNIDDLLGDKEDDPNELEPEEEEPEPPLSPELRRSSRMNLNPFAKIPGTKLNHFCRVSVVTIDSIKAPFRPSALHGSGRNSDVLPAKMVSAASIDYGLKPLTVPLQRNAIYDSPKPKSTKPVKKKSKYFKGEKSVSKKNAISNYLEKVAKAVA